MHTPMQQGSIHIGTSGWSYRHWRGSFYPQQLKAAGWLRYYAALFNTAEINASFYRIPAVETVASWASQVPPGFLFCAKMSRYLTHFKKLRDAEAPLQRFFNAFAPLSHCMGPVLLQLPPNLGFHADMMHRFCSLLVQQYPQHSFVVEARHVSWLQPEAATLLRQWGIGWVIAQSGTTWPYSELITAPDIYLRFHGPAQLYASAYSDEELAHFAGRLQQWQSEGYRVWAFFNNDIHGYAPRDAQRLARMCGTAMTPG